MITTQVLMSPCLCPDISGSTFEINQKTKLYISRCLKLPKSLRMQKLVLLSKVPLKVEV